MITSIIFRVKEALAILRDKGFVFLFKRLIYRNSEWVVTEKDLGSLKDSALPQLETGLELVEINRDLWKSEDLVYTERNEYIRALNYLNKGYHGFAIMRGHVVCGYIWYSMIDTARYKANHPHVRLTGIASEENSAYMFSMYVSPEMRGKNLAEYLQYSTFNHLRGLGVCKAYGAYETRNIPALWVHRQLKWKEVKKLKVSQFIFLKSATLQS